MAIFSNITRPVLDVFKSIDNADGYADIKDVKEAAKKGRSAFSTLVRILFVMIIAFALSAFFLVKIIIERPSQQLVESKDIELERVYRKLDKYERILIPRMDSLATKYEEVNHKATDNEEILNKALKKANEK